MGQMLGGGADAPAATPDMSVGYTGMDPSTGAGFTGATGAGGPTAVPGQTPAVGGGQGGMMGALASGFSKLSELTKLLGSNPDEIKKNAQVLGAMAKDLGSARQAMTDSTLMKRVIEHGMRAPLAVFGGQTPQSAARIQPTFSGEAAAQAGQWRGMR